MGFVQLSLLTLQTYSIIHMQLWITGLLLAVYITMVLPVIPRYQMFNRRNYRVVCTAGYTRAAGKVGFTLSVHMKMHQLNAGLLFLQMHIAIGVIFKEKCCFFVPSGEQSYKS